MSITHAVITGMSQSGKSLLAKTIARATLTRGRPVLVFDPMMAGHSGAGLNGWPGGAHVVGDWERFKAIALASRSCLLIIDECADVVEEDPIGLRRLMRRGRHIGADGCGGHSIILIAQRYLLSLDKSARDQASHVFAFCQSAADAKAIAGDFNAPALEQKIPVMPRLSYIMADKYGAQVVGTVKIPRG